MGETATPRRGLNSFASEKNVVFCDVWGVVHNGIRAFDAATDALTRFRRNGGTVILVTNAPVPAERVQQRLDAMRVPRAAYDGIATAGDVAIDELVALDGAPLCVIGGGEDDPLVAEARRLSRRTLEFSTIHHASAVLCIGLDSPSHHPRDYVELLSAAKQRDLPMICANPDLVVEVGTELVFCAGAIAEIYAEMGGPVIQTGKPYGRIYDRACKFAESVRGSIARTSVLAIGDGAATDLAGAGSYGIDCLFITTGIHRGVLHPESEDAANETALRTLIGDRTRPIAVASQLAWALPG